MSRNPIAGSLKHFRQRIVPDKRRAWAEAFADEWLANAPDLPGPFDEQDIGG
jgi:hypothetical protein